MNDEIRGRDDDRSIPSVGGEADTGERLLRAAVEASPCGSVVVSADGRIVLVNGEIERLFGYGRSQLVGRSVDELIPMRLRGAHGVARARYFTHPEPRAMGEGRPLFGLRRDGTEFPLEVGLTPVQTVDGPFVVAAVVDISGRVREERRRQSLEEELGRRRRLESVGTLVSGVAHEFNNVLTSILGFAELAGGAPSLADAQPDLREIVVAATRGRDLVARLRSFAPSAPSATVAVDVIRLIDDLLPALQRAMPADVWVRTAHPVSAAVAPVNAGAVRGLLEQVAQNAAFAMPEGGLFVITVDHVEVPEGGSLFHPALRPGRYVLVACRDTGAGMDESTRDRAFDPFFTTRSLGQGPGLGLAMVHGVMLEHRGAVRLDSAPGRGTTVLCYFPADV